MKLSNKLKAARDEALQHDYYWVEKAKLDFAIDLERQRRTAGMTYAAIAEKLKTSAAYISKIFRGDTNVTIESMVKLARATGGRLDIQIIDTAPAQILWAKPVRPQTGTPALVSNETVVQLMAANNEHYQHWNAA